MSSLLAQRFPLAAYLRSRGFIEHSNGEWTGRCPRCGKDGKVAVSVPRRAWHCFVCQQKGLWRDPATGLTKLRVTHGGGGVVRLVAWLEQVPTAVAFQRVADAARAADRVDLSRLDDFEPAPPPRHVLLAERPAIPLPEGVQPIRSPIPYLAHRGISMADVAQFGLLYCPPGSGRYADRVVFPVWQAGRPIYWQARACYEASEVRGRFIKAINPPRDPRFASAADVLFNLDQARHFESVVITEGPIDAIHVGPDAVAAFGKNLAPGQVSALIEAGVRNIEIMLDGPSPTEPSGAWDDAVRMARSLAPSFHSVRVVPVPTGDPGSLDRQQNWQLRSRGIPVESLT